MTENKKRLWLISLLAIYIAIAVAGFTIVYIVKKEFLSTTPPVISQAKTITTPVPLPTGWKTYSNTDYSITFAYPPTDSFKPTSYGFGVTSLELHNTKTNVLDFQILMMPSTLAAAVGQSFDDYFALPDNTTKIIKSPLSKDNTTEKFTKIRNRSIDGNPAVDYQSIASNAQSNEQPEIGTIIKSGNNVLLISTGKSNQTLLEDLLRTFHSS